MITSNEESKKLRMKPYTTFEEATKYIPEPVPYRCKGCGLIFYSESIYYKIIFNDYGSKYNESKNCPTCGASLRELTPPEQRDLELQNMFEQAALESELCELVYGPRVCMELNNGGKYWILRETETGEPILAGSKGYIEEKYDDMNKGWELTKTDLMRRFKGAIEQLSQSYFVEQRVATEILLDDIISTAGDIYGAQFCREIRDNAYELAKKRLGEAYAKEICDKNQYASMAACNGYVK